MKQASKDRSDKMIEKIASAISIFMLIHGATELMIFLVNQLEPGNKVRQYLKGIFVYSSFPMFVWGTVAFIKYALDYNEKEEKSTANLAWSFLCAGILAQIFANYFNMSEAIGAELLMGSMIVLKLIESIEKIQDRKLNIYGQARGLFGRKFNIYGQSRRLFVSILRFASIIMDFLMLVLSGVSIPCCTASAMCLYIWRHPDIFSRIGRACELCVTRLKGSRNSEQSSAILKTDPQNKWRWKQLISAKIPSGVVGLGDLEAADSSGMTFREWLLSGQSWGHQWGRGQKLGSSASNIKRKSTDMRPGVTYKK